MTRRIEKRWCAICATRRWSAHRPCWFCGSREPLATEKPRVTTKSRATLQAIAKQRERDAYARAHPTQNEGRTFFEGLRRQLLEQRAREPVVFTATVFPMRLPEGRFYQ